MISKESIERILDTARIEEVIGDFVTLKKRGSNLVGLCPFHHEKTPSFHVSPSRNIFKCFGCGKGGNVISFLMEHEHYTYVEALKFLASRYGIEIIEEYDEEQDRQQAERERESLFLVHQFAWQFYRDYLFHSDEGQAIGLTYLKERRLNDAMIRKFGLGMAPDAWDSLLTAALEKGYRKELLAKAGLIAQREDASGSLPSFYDRFRNRIIFPIYNLSGSVIAFGARVLKNDPKSPRYINSPETEIYHKSKVLYGLHLAKKAICDNDECLLTEGYMDVIALHQAGIENAVASSGTSLTEEQIRLIGRYTKNITVLFDGDPAGIKASLRSIDLILEQGLNVKVVLFPDGEDPDSFARKHSRADLLDLIQHGKKDFITFKTTLLLKEAGTDPPARSSLIHQVIESIARIPDLITREMYVRQCSTLLNVQEQTLHLEINKIRRRQFEKIIEKNIPLNDPRADSPAAGSCQPLNEFISHDAQEAEIIRLLLNYFHEPITINRDPAQSDNHSYTFKVGPFIISQLKEDEIVFENLLFGRMFSIITQHETNFHPLLLTTHDDPLIRQAAIDLISERHALHQWEKTGITVKTEKENLTHQVLHAIYMVKIRKVMTMLNENIHQIEQATRANEDITDLLRQRNELEALKKELAGFLGIVIL
jgi:DNA primase